MVEQRKKVQKNNGTIIKYDLRTFKKGKMLRLNKSKSIL